MVSSNMVVTSKEPSDNFQMRQQFSKLRTHIERAAPMDLRYSLKLMRHLQRGNSSSKELHCTESGQLERALPVRPSFGPWNSRLELHIQRDTESLRKMYSALILSKSDT